MRLKTCKMIQKSRPSQQTESQLKKSLTPIASVLLKLGQTEESSCMDFASQRNIDPPERQKKRVPMLCQSIRNRPSETEGTCATAHGEIKIFGAGENIDLGIVKGGRERERSFNTVKINGFLKN